MAAWASGRGRGRDRALECHGYYCATGGGSRRLAAVLCRLRLDLDIKSEPEA
jgi:hypothetical protein